MTKTILMQNYEEPIKIINEYGVLKLIDVPQKMHAMQKLYKSSEIWVTSKFDGEFLCKIESGEKILELHNRSKKSEGVI